MREIKFRAWGLVSKSMISWDEIRRYWYPCLVTAMLLWIIYWTAILISLLYGIWLNERLATGEQYQQLLSVCNGSGI